MYAAVFIFDPTYKWLLCGREAKGKDKGLWCAPGGKIEPGELPHTAAEREFEEETIQFFPPLALTLITPWTYRQGYYYVMEMELDHFITNDFNTYYHHNIHQYNKPGWGELDTLKWFSVQYILSHPLQFRKHFIHALRQYYHTYNI